MDLHQSFERKILDDHLRDLHREHQKEIDSLLRSLVLSQFGEHASK